MSRKAKIRGILGKRGIHNYDIVIFLLFMALLFLLKGNVPYLQDLVSFRSEISLGYIAKQQGDRIYVIDSGHSRLLCFDTAGNEIFEVTDPSDDGESVLYIDDIAPDEDGLYLSASEWDGMQIAREVILRLDRNGQYVNTVVSRWSARNAWMTASCCTGSIRRPFPTMWRHWSAGTLSTRSGILFLTRICSRSFWVRTVRSAVS